jgi:hypothetical protein
MQLVGKAFDDYGSRVPVVGITPWGVIPNQEEMRTRYDGKSCTFQTHDQKNRVWPDPNHTHFLWVDNGRKDTWGAEVDLRSKIETATCSPAMKWEDNGPTQGLQNDEKRYRACSSSVAHGEQAAAAEFVDLDRQNSIPCVCIAYEGGPGTILTVYTEVKQNMAVVVVNGSGRCCDVFCYAAKHVEKLRTLAGKGGGRDRGVSPVGSHRGKGVVQVGSEGREEAAETEGDGQGEASAGGQAPTFSLGAPLR